MDIHNLLQSLNVFASSTLHHDGSLGKTKLVEDQLPDEIPDAIGFLSLFQLLITLGV